MPMRLETARAICPTMHCALPPPCQAKNPASEPSVAFGERLDQQEDPPAADRRWRRSVRLGLAPQRRFLLQRQRMMDGMAESPFSLVLAGRLQAILLGVWRRMARPGFDRGVVAAIEFHARLNCPVNRRSTVSYARSRPAMRACSKSRYKCPGSWWRTIRLP